MIVNPDMMKTSHIATSSVAPIPTVIPTPPTIVESGDTGRRTLWYVTIDFRKISSFSQYF